MYQISHHLDTKNPGLDLKMEIKPRNPKVNRFEGNSHNFNSKTVDLDFENAIPGQWGEEFGLFRPQ